MTSAIETLAINLEAAAGDKVYKTMQKLLKEARDSFKVRLECALNKSSIVLGQECIRVATAIRNGTVQEQQPAVAKAKAKAAQATTHTSDKKESAVASSQPKQVAVEQQLAEAQAEIERLRRELADKTNEVAEYASALGYARQTITQQAAVIKGMQTAAPVEAEDDSDDSDEDTSDAADKWVLLAIDGNQELCNAAVVEVVKQVQRIYGERKANTLVELWGELKFDSFGKLAQEIRDTFAKLHIKLSLLEDAMTLVK